MKGRFVTGTDVGMYRDDLQVMRERTRYVVGALGDPTVFTVQGIVDCMKVVLEEMYGSSSLTGRSVAIQGLGKIGFLLLSKLYEEGVSLYAADIDAGLADKAFGEFPGVRLAAPSEIAFQEVDIFAPCAMSGDLTSEVAAKVKIRPADNQSVITSSGYFVSLQ